MRDAPAVFSGVVFITTTDGNLYAVDADTADTRWRVDMADHVSTSPVVSEGVVFIVSLNGRVYAWDELTGDLRWQYDTGGLVYTSLVVAGGMVYVSGILYMHALDAHPTD